MTTDTAVCLHCGEPIEPTGGKLYLWTHVDGDQQKCTVARPVDKGELLEDTLNNRIREMEEAIDRVMGSPRSKGDWERGYAKGYARALEQLVELAEFHLPTHVEMIQAIALKLRKDVGQDA